MPISSNEAHYDWLDTWTCYLIALLKLNHDLADFTASNEEGLNSTAAG